MHERAAAWSGVVSLEADLEREFEVQLDHPTHVP
jgi:hypothetical protein